MRFLVILIVLSIGLPVACNTCGFGSGPDTELKMIDQEISNVEVIVSEPTSSMYLRITIRYIPEVLAAADIKKTWKLYGGAYACSPPPQIFVNLVDNISITSNADIYDIKAGDELISLFQRVNFSKTEPLIFPVQLELGDYFVLAMVGPKPSNPEHTFLIKTETSDNQVFKSEVTVIFQ